MPACEKCGNYFRSFSALFAHQPLCDHPRPVVAPVVAKGEPAPVKEESDWSATPSDAQAWGDTADTTAAAAGESWADACASDGGEEAPAEAVDPRTTAEYVEAAAQRVQQVLKGAQYVFMVNLGRVLLPPAPEDADEPPAASPCGGVLGRYDADASAATTATDATTRTTSVFHTTIDANVTNTNGVDAVTANDTTTTTTPSAPPRAPGVLSVRWLRQLLWYGEQQWPKGVAVVLYGWARRQTEGVACGDCRASLGRLHYRASRHRLFIRACDLTVEQVWDTYVKAHGSTARHLIHVTDEEVGKLSRAPRKVTTLSPDTMDPHEALQPLLMRLKCFTAADPEGVAEEEDARLLLEHSLVPETHILLPPTVEQMEERYMGVVVDRIRAWIRRTNNLPSSKYALQNAVTPFCTIAEEVYAAPILKRMMSKGLVAKCGVCLRFTFDNLMEQVPPEEQVHHRQGPPQWDHACRKLRSWAIGAHGLGYPSTYKALLSMLRSFRVNRQLLPETVVSTLMELGDVNVGDETNRYRMRYPAATGAGYRRIRVVDVEVPIPTTKVVQSALIVMPPKDVWPQIQVLRKMYDKAFQRWMPHINLLYPFVPDEHFPSCARLLQNALSHMDPFVLSFDKLGYFEHGPRSFTLYAEPTTSPSDAFADLQSRLVALFPACTDLRERDPAHGFRPHLTLGQFRHKSDMMELMRRWSTITWTVTQVHLISRRDREPFQVRHSLRLGERPDAWWQLNMDDRSPQGPFTRAQLRQRIDAGAVAELSMVRRSGEDVFVSAKMHPEVDLMLRDADAEALDRGGDGDHDGARAHAGDGGGDDGDARGDGARASSLARLLQRVGPDPSPGWTPWEDVAAEHGLGAAVMRGVYGGGFVHASPVQAASVPTVLEGKDHVIQGRAGSGKTAAYLIPLLQQVVLSQKKCQVMIVTPSRELAEQVIAMTKVLGVALRGLRVHALLGTRALGALARSLRLGAHVVAGPPSVLTALIARKVLPVGGLRCVVFEEAGDLTHEPQAAAVRKLWATVRVKRQRRRGRGSAEAQKQQLQRRRRSKPRPRIQVLCIATMLRESEGSALGRYVREPVHVDDTQALPTRVSHQYWNVYDDHDVGRYVFQVHEMLSSGGGKAQGIVFCPNRAYCEWIVRQLADIYKLTHVACVHGGNDVPTRLAALKAFRGGRQRLLIATPSVARGLDVPNVRVVLMAKVAHSLATYISMASRCGRFVDTGVAVTFVTDAWQTTNHGDQHHRLSLLQQDVHIERAKPPELRRTIAALTAMD